MIPLKIPVLKAEICEKIFSHISKAGLDFTSKAEGENSCARKLKLLLLINSLTLDSSAHAS